MTHSDNDMLPLDRSKEIDRLADQFERMYRNGEQPQIEHFLDRLPECRQQLLNELLVIELELRRSAGNPAELDELLQRYPDDATVVEAAFTAIEETIRPSTVQQSDRLDGDAESSGPTQIDRYVIERLLGRGGFGVVYLAHDPHLDRRVALKVPRKTFEREEQLESFIREARTAARLKHPSLVAVFDVQESDGQPYIIQEYVEGVNLGKWVAGHEPDVETLVRILIDIADALTYAHEQGLTHCDLKLANVLMDADGSPHVADFGLAIHESNRTLLKGNVVGTPAVMAPEQVRGEGHRLDRRTDIWAIGVMMYELLVGQAPFQASRNSDLADMILVLDPIPPRQINEAIPRELERICLKCLSKRRTDRYPTTKSLREDLSSWLNSQTSERDTVWSTPPSDQGVPWTSQDSSGVIAPVVQVIPKGLRSFDAEDADFFLDLLPGPRGRNGLPELLRFWKSRIEMTDADSTFSVGLIYGSSGCGKTSLVKAGLIPNLSPDVLPVYIEASAHDTESKLCDRLCKAVTNIPPDSTLIQACSSVRLADPDTKVLLIIDQFEQWLNSHSEFKKDVLVDALRQCDGAQLQTILMVRDDFYLSINRLFQELEIPLREGHNQTVVDLFDIQHAAKVLTAFGRSYGQLGSTLTPAQESFVRQSVQELSEDSKVNCVRLSLFADLMRGRPWVAESLMDVGGVHGLGVTYLEESVSGRSAPPSHRANELPLRQVLTSLLPEASSDIKGNVRTETELCEATGLPRGSRQMEQVLGILDRDLRLITPSDSDSASRSDPTLGSRRFGLTHDYLVPALREWLTQKQHATRKGRAELRLAERATLWDAKQENRYLPSLSEWIHIQMLTDHRRWTGTQRAMMSKTGWLHGLRAGVMVLFLLTAAIAGITFRHRTVAAQDSQRAAGLVTALTKAKIEEVPEIIQELQAYARWAEPELKTALQQTQPDPSGQLNVSLALLPFDFSQLDYLKERLINAEPQQIETICSQLSDYQDKLLPELWRIAENPDRADQLLPVASALAKFDATDQTRWQAIGDRTADQLVKQNPLRASVWVEALRPAHDYLVPRLCQVFRLGDDNEDKRKTDLATHILEDYVEDDVKILSELLLDADPKQFVAIFDELDSHGNAAASLLDSELDRQLQHHWDDAPPNPSWNEPAADLVRRIESANGIVAERFAMCQTMRMVDFKQIAEQLRGTGYRPIRLRPYADGDGVRFAAVWTRDSRDWRIAMGLPREAVDQNVARQRTGGFVPIDVAGYIKSHNGMNHERFALLWSEMRDPTEEARIQVGLEYNEFGRQELQIRKDGFRSYHSVQAYRGIDGEQKHCGVARLDERLGIGLLQSSLGFNLNKYPDMIPWDVDPSDAPTVPSGAKLLAIAESDLRSNPTNLWNIFRRGVAHFYLGNDDQALADISALLEKYPHRLKALEYRAILNARRGDLEQLAVDLSTYKAKSSSRLANACLDLVVSACVGYDDETMEQLERVLVKSDNEPSTLYRAARAYSSASGYLRDTQPELADRYADRAVGLIAQAVGLGFRRYAQLVEDADLDPIRQREPFQKILRDGDVATHYALILNQSDRFEAEMHHGLTPAEHLSVCRQRMADGFRPFAIGAAAVDDQITTASVWRRPLISIDAKETQARRRANAAIAMFRFGRADELWPLMKHQPDPRLRSWIIHRIARSGCDARQIIERFTVESDVSIKRALLQALGEFDELQIAPQQRDQVVDRLVGVFRHHPDPGLHASAEWLLRQWGFGHRVDSINDALSRENANTSTVGKRAKRWFVNRFGQTFVSLRGGRVLMGSPATERNRESGENLHYRRINRTIAIAAKEVTVDQFRLFKNSAPSNEHFYKNKHAPGGDCPQTSVTWYEAAWYCNWLSEQDGIPPDQWCFEPNAQGEYANGMKVRNNFLELSGYRLPTEAEWEYACRAGTTTSRYFGDSEELLGEYAWYRLNSDDRTWPAGLRKPNDFGLFDMHGNVWNWCIDLVLTSGYPHRLRNAIDAPSRAVVTDAGNRVMRGGSWYAPKSFLRSAARYNNRPDSRTYSYGFRLARTLKNQQ